VQEEAHALAHLLADKAQPSKHAVDVFASVHVLVFVEQAVQTESEVPDVPGAKK